LSRIKLHTPVWRCSGSPKGSSSFFACSQKIPPAPAGGVSLKNNLVFTYYYISLEGELKYVKK